MATKEIKNVLVLGTEGVKTSQFCKLFEAYLFYDCYDDAIAWQPTLLKDNAINRPTILVNNLKLICTPDLEGSFISKQIISVLSKFQEEHRLSAIIILLKQNPEENRHLMKLKSFLFNVLEEFSENILYVYELDYENQKTDEALELFVSNQDNVETIKTQLNIFGAKNIFYLNKNTFYNVTDNNWLAGVNLCTSINNYIAGDGDKNGLETFHIKIDISKKLLSNLIDNLLELLIQIYIYNNIKHFIKVNNTYEQQSIYIFEYKRNVTVCYGNTCSETITYYDHNLVANVNTKLPKICHASCNCMKAINDVTNCKIFETPNTTCMQCNCNAGFHSQNYFKTSIEKYCNAKMETRNIIHVLAQFYLFKKQEQETIDFKDIFGKLLNLDHSNDNTIFNDFNNELNKKVKLLENYFLRTINIVKVLEDLYGIKESGKIIPKFVEEVFPKDIQLQTIKLKLETNMPNNESNIKPSEIDTAKIKIQTLTDEVAALKDMMGKILNSNKDNVMEDNINCSNSQLNQVETSVNGNKNSKEKDNELNLELNLSTNKIKNVLVLSTDSVNSGKFCKLFEAYLSYDSYENAVTWQPKLKKDKGINQPSIFVNNLKLICIPNLEGSFISKHIISVLSNLQEQQTLNAIMILSKQNCKGNIHLIKLQSFLSNVLHKFPANILYIYELNTSYQCQETITEHLNIFGVKDNIFHLSVNMFYNISKDNWRAGVTFCSNINNYIDGDGDKKGLESIYIQNNISKEILLHVINNLLELLIYIYILNNTKYFINVADNYEQRSIFIEKCKRNVTVCYGDRCATGITNYKQDYKYYYRKRPKICHSSCNCINANRDVAKCITFETPKKTCIECNCHSKFHTQNYFKVVYVDEYINVEDEGQIAMEAITKFYLFKKQNQETLDFKDIFGKFLYLTNENSKTIFDRFNSEFNENLKLYEGNSVEPLDILNTINKLYDMKNSGRIIPEFIEEVFPTDIRLKTCTPKLEPNAPNNETRIKTLCETVEINDAKFKLQLLSEQVTELIHMIDKKNDVAEENANDLNSQINQDDIAETDNVNLIPDEKDIEEKELNWNIERQESN